MKTTDQDMEFLYAYMNKRGVDFKVDKNPTEEKLNKIQQAIQRKNALIKKALETYKGAYNNTINA
jgi:hypothetical protein